MSTDRLEERDLFADDLKGPQEAFLFDDEQTPSQALRLFQSFLYNHPEERERLTNAIELWDLVPKYAGAKFNSMPQSEMPQVFETSFEFRDNKMHLQMLPGRIVTKKRNGEEKTVQLKYPGGTEEAIETALISLAADQGVMRDQQGSTVYGVRFSINQLRNKLEAMGCSRSHEECVSALDVMNTAAITLSDDKGRVTQRTPMIGELTCITPAGNARRSPNASWIVSFHPLVTSCINNATYRQYNLERLIKRSSHFGRYVTKKMILVATNMSPEHPFKVTLQEVKSNAEGLGYKRLRDSVKVFERELDSMVADGTLTAYEREERRGKRRVLLDVIYHLYPDKPFISELKAASTRQRVVEQDLGLPRSKRRERQLTMDVGE